MGVDYRQGDYRVVADRLRPASAELVAWAAPRPGGLVVDVGAGTGNLARLCAARGARAVAVDQVREQLLLGAAEGGDGIAWVVGDAHALPLRDRVADATLSVFGAIYAERPQQAVAELGRVTRPGGSVGLTAWPDEGYQQAFSLLLQEVFGEVTRDHLAVWGASDRLAGLLSAAADDVEVRTAELVDRFPSVDAWWRTREFSPPLAAARQRLDAADYAELGRRFRAVVEERGEHGDGVVVRERYLLALGRAR